MQESRPTSTGPLLMQINPRRILASIGGFPRMVMKVVAITTLVGLAP